MSQRCIFFLTLSILAACILGIVIHYFVFLETYRSEPIGSRSEYEFNAVLARYYPFDAIITGSSMSQNFKCSEFDKVCGGYSQKLTVYGCAIEKMCFMVEYACKYHRVRTVLADLHNRLVVGMPPGRQPEDEYYNDNNFWGNLRDGASLKTLTARRVYYSDKKKKRRRNEHKKVSRDDLYCWGKDYPCGKRWLARDLQAPPRPTKLVEHPKYAAVNVEKFLLPLIRRHPEIKFYFYLPPFSLFAYTGREDYLVARKVVMDSLTDLPNVELYDFQAASEVVLDLENYKDTTHYSPRINSWILEQIKAGKYRVTSENRHEFDARFGALRKSFDPVKEKNELISFVTQKYGSEK